MNKNSVHPDQLALGHAKYFFRFSSPPTHMKYKQIEKIGVEGFSKTFLFFIGLTKKENV